MNIKTVIVGALATNCYLLEKEDKCIIIDPGDDAREIIKSIDKEVVGIFITHSHFDHIGAKEELKRYYHTKVYDHSNLKEGLFEIGPFSFHVLFTPGHLDDSITLYFIQEKKMFVGDFIFKHSIGRIDLEGANPDDMKKSIETILTYPKDIILYPGHGEKTTLEEETATLEFYASRFL